MRRLISFECTGATLVGTLDGEAATHGVLIVAGGRQTRTGPHRLFERLAHRLAGEGLAVLRFDRRGVGDSDGADPGFAGSAPDIIAAAEAFRAACPGLSTLTAIGLCDGATAAAIAARAAAIDRLILLNPWVIEPAGALPPRAAIAATYRARIASPAAWLRLLRGGVDLRKAARGLRALAAPAEDSSLFDRLVLAIVDTPTRVVLANRDGTAQAFAALWRGAPPLVIDSASHSFAGAGDFEALVGAVLAYAAA